jgi:hypothetical protein
LKDIATGEDLFLNVMETVACLDLDWEKLTRVKLMASEMLISPEPVE